MHERERTRTIFRATVSKEMPYPPDPETELDRALHTLREEVVKGLRHGYFEYSIRGQITNGEKRILTITAGVSHRFTILLEDLKP